MPRYSVTVERTTTELVYLTIDAEDDDEAYKLAEEQAKDDNKLEWELEDQDYDITECEEDTSEVDADNDR